MCFAEVSIYPIVFLYRHHLELNLKDIIRRGNKLLDAPIEPKENRLHSLDELWKVCRTILENAGISVDTPEFPEAAHFEFCIKDFEKFDPESLSFRYPETKGGVPILPSNLNSIDLANLKMVVERMSFLLEITRDTIVERTRNFNCAAS